MDGREDKKGGKERDGWLLDSDRAGNSGDHGRTDGRTDGRINELNGWDNGPQITIIKRE